MTPKDLTIKITVDKTPQEAFKGITNLKGWWSEEIEGGTEKLNDEFHYHYKDIHVCRMKLVELIPDQKAVWIVLENYFNFTKDNSEWKGTRLSFEINKSGTLTEIVFTHHGLGNHYECYEVCSEAWTNYITNSLRNLINTGKGQPNPKEGEGYNAQLSKKWNLN